LRAMDAGDCCRARPVNMHARMTSVAMRQVVRLSPLWHSAERERERVTTHTNTQKSTATARERRLHLLSWPLVSIMLSDFWIHAARCG